MAGLKTTRPGEIKIVEQRLAMFGNSFNAALKAKLLAPTPRMEQHRLF